MAIPISSTYSVINPNFLLYEGFELAVETIIPTLEQSSSFSQVEDKVEFYIYNSSKDLLYQNNNFTNYLVNTINSNESSTPSGMINFNELELDPINDVYIQGYSTGNYYAVYNFIKYELGSEQPYYISEISSDRTEIRLKNNYILNNLIQDKYSQFSTNILSKNEFDEFYIDFGNNKYFICINSKLELASNGEASVLVKLYKSLPSNYKLLDTLSVKSKVSETNAFEVKFIEDLGIIDDLIYLRGPNINVDIKDKINNSTEYKTLSSLNNSTDSGSLSQLNYLKNRRGVQIHVDYSDFSKFVHFSSAEQRLRNFYEKQISLETFQSQLNSLYSIATGVSNNIIYDQNNSIHPGFYQNSPYSSSIASVNSKIKNITENYDGYEYFLSQIKSPNSWPKNIYTSSATSLTASYDINRFSLHSYTSSQVKNWFGSTDENNEYFNTGKNQIYSASLYDENNVDYLKHLIPSFILNDPSNDPYFKFVGMTGQSFDEIWLYTEAIQNTRNTSNQLTGSVLPLDLASEAIESLGWDNYGNSFNSQQFNPKFVGISPNQTHSVGLPSTGSIGFKGGITNNQRIVIETLDGNYIRFIKSSTQNDGDIVVNGGIQYLAFGKNSTDDGTGNAYANSFVTVLTSSISWSGQFALSYSGADHGGVNGYGSANTITFFTTATGSIQNNIQFNSPAQIQWNNFSGYVPNQGPNPPFFINGSDFIPGGANEYGRMNGQEFITRYVDAASGSIINYYDNDFTTLGYVLQLANPGYPYPVDGSQREIYKRIFTNMVSLVKRKGTITGLRQLINIWGVPSTCLRISEFGGKNKIDEGDYDLWMDRSSTYFSTWPNKKQSNDIWTESSGALGTIQCPWRPLTKNYYEAGGTNIKLKGGIGTTPNSVYLPDCIQFRFKTATKSSPNTSFSESLMYANYNGQVGNFGITLEVNIPQTSSYSGSIQNSVFDPYQTYASMSFVIKGDLAEGASVGGYYKSPHIYLPFYNGDWWSVQIQRMNHYSASVNSLENNYELRVGQKGYEGYDGNQLLYSGITTIGDSNGIVSSSMHASWNYYETPTVVNFPTTATPPNVVWSQTSSIAIIGANTIPGSSKYNLGQHFSGAYQEIRYYTHAVSQSSFNDFVMNPESIQGQNHENRGRKPGTSYFNVAYRIPLGNENEYSHVKGTPILTSGIGFTSMTFGSSSLIANNSNNSSIGSVHPSIVNHRGSLFTSSFIGTLNNLDFGLTSSYYQLIWPSQYPTHYSSSLTASFIQPQDEVVYMDQPSVGVRNRLTNKIEVIDEEYYSKNTFGNILTPFRSIQQNPIQNQSSTEDLNLLEVGFSFQNEINDDIIATFGHGVVSDAIADPRFTSESSDRYPELTKIAEDYFLKYQGPTATSNINPNWDLPSQVEKEWDYNRLIKFYETSLFKAIKNYIPARTSLSTGIIVKQHLLERNRRNQASINIKQELGVSTSNLLSPGWNQFDSKKNLEITSSIEVASLTGEAGGSVNKYNTLNSSIGGFTQSWDYLDNFTGTIQSHSIQDEFYNGEFSGSNPQFKLNEYNPYRIFADGNDITPDETLPLPEVDFTQGGGNSFFTVISPTVLYVLTPAGGSNAYSYFTGSFKNLQFQGFLIL
jgi:hypothetical protein